MDERWNFHNYIGTPLKNICDARGTKEFVIDELAQGAFIEAMLDVLRVDPQKLSQCSTFFNLCVQYYGKWHYDIPKDVAQTLFEAFQTIINE